MLGPYTSYPLIGVDNAIVIGGAAVVAGLAVTVMVATGAWLVRLLW